MPRISSQPVSAANEYRRKILAIVLVLLVAEVIRAVYLLQYRAHVPYFDTPILDSAYYDAWAMRVAQGQGYGPMPFYMAPLYPYVLAVVYAVAGHSLSLIYILQSILGLANLLLVYVLASRAFGRRSGLIAMVLMTAYAPMVYLETKLLTETLAITLNLASLLFLMRALRRPTITGFGLAGITFGLSALCRPSALLMAILIGAWLLILVLRSKSGMRLGHVLALGVGIMLAILPVTARNYVVGGDFALITTNGGLVFAQANNPGANGVSAAVSGFTGSILTQQEEEMTLAAKVLGHTVTPSESSSYWLGRGLDFIRSEPVKFARLIGLKLVWSLHNREADCSYNVYLEATLVPILRFLAVPFFLLAGLSLFGLIVARRDADSHQLSILVLYAVSVFLSLLIFSVSSRYRVPAIPIMCALAGYGLSQIAKRTVLAIGMIAVFAGISLLPFPQPPITTAALANLGTNYISNSKTDVGIDLLKQAIALDPQHEMLHLGLGNALMAKGRLDEAIEHLTRAVEITPDRPEMHTALGLALLKKGDAPRAEAEFREAIKLEPMDAEAHLGLANALQAQNRLPEAQAEWRLLSEPARECFARGTELHSQGNLGEALEQYREAVRLNPQFADAFVSMGLALKDQGKLDEAIQQYRRAVRIQPNIVRAHNNLAVALYLQGRYAEAWQEVHASRKYGGTPHPGFLQALSDKMPEPKETK